MVVLYPEKGGLAMVDEDEVEKRYGIPGRSYADFAVLRGDPSDGLPGVPGVGPKTAAGLLRRYGGLDGVLKSLDYGPATRDYVERARRVVAPVTDLELPEPKVGLDPAGADREQLDRLNRELGMAPYTTRLLKAMGGP